jgi:hypothetical protein
MASGACFFAFSSPASQERIKIDLIEQLAANIV